MTRPQKPAGMPPGYNAREQSLWTQIQGLHQHTGRLEDRIAQLEKLTARQLAQYRELRGVVEHILANAGIPEPEGAAVEGGGQ